MSYPAPTSCARCGRDTIGTVLLGMCRVCSQPGADGKVATPEGARVSPATAVLMTKEQRERERCICFDLGATGANQRHTLCPAHTK